MIEFIKIRGFKSIKGFRMKLKPLNILTRGNGSGKKIFLTVFLALSFVEFYSYGQELVWVHCINEKYGYIDKETGEMIIPCKYDLALPFFEGLALVRLERNWKFIDNSDKEVFPFKYDDLMVNYSFYPLIAYQLNYKWGVIDNTGAVVVPIKFTSSFEAQREIVNI